MGRVPRLAWIVALLASAWSPPLEADAPATMPGPAPRSRREDPAIANARCEGCHADIAAEQRGSMHARAHTDPVYRRALALEPLPFCRGCHAPEADPAREAPRALGDLGVGCVTCHVPEGAVIATPRSGARVAPHAVQRVDAFATAAACARCHDFAFPGADPHDPRQRMQSTASEHARSSFANVSCASCHMPGVTRADGTTHASHAFRASRDPAIVRGAVVARASRRADGDVEIVVSTRGVGHAFPTGDLFRRVLVSAEAVGPEQDVVAEGRRALARRFGLATDRDGRVLKVLTSDTRVAAGAESVVRLALGAKANGRPVAWRVAYQRVEHPVDATGDAAVVESEVEIAAGVLAP